MRILIFHFFFFTILSSLPHSPFPANNNKIIIIRWIYGYIFKSKLNLFDDYFVTSEVIRDGLSVDEVGMSYVRNQRLQSAS